jgi:hypothetical protein
MLMQRRGHVTAAVEIHDDLVLATEPKAHGCGAIFKANRRMRHTVPECKLDARLCRLWADILDLHCTKAGLVVAHSLVCNILMETEALLGASQRRLDGLEDEPKCYCMKMTR